MTSHTFLVISMQITGADNENSSSKRGSFASDQKNGYTLHWNTWADFESWLRKEQTTKTIELVRKNIRKAVQGLPWVERHEFVCSRQGAGSLPKYVCKDAERKRNIPSKRSGCPCRLTIKIYPNTAEILGFYNGQHSHTIGDGNIKFTRLSKEVKDRVAQLLQLGVENERVVSGS
jgi:hypothetical protein